MQMHSLRQSAWFVLSATVVASIAISTCSAESCPRRTISLNGNWQVTTGSPDELPKEFERTIPVPGVVDMATPPFENLGQNTKQRTDSPQFLAVDDPNYEVFWYRRSFAVPGEIPEVAILKLGKAKFGSRIWLNGEPVGEHWPCFTPGYFDVREQLCGNGQENQLVVRVGADPLSVGDRAANGYDFEKSQYLAGIYDDVTLQLAGSPFIANVQVVPQVSQKSIRVVAELRNNGNRSATSDVEFHVSPYREDGAILGRATLENVEIGPGQTSTVEVTIPISNCRLWTPESPTLYYLTSSTATDSLRTRFGVREFHFDSETQIGRLNGKPYYLRGTNICYFRFEEDPKRGGKPWDEAWVRKLHRRFKSLNMNAIRYCIGLPPELWYRIADEEGLIIQDEFPVWTLSEDKQTPVTVDRLADEYRDWMREHWNHASVLIWDAQNESRFDKTREALGRVRELDFSNRPWDNGWGKPHQPADVIEDHPYQYSGSMLVASWTPKLKPMPKLDEVLEKYSKLGPDGPRPRIVNEYAWLWLQRDGTPTTLTSLGYKTYLPNADADQRREFYAGHLAAMTEALRASRHVAGVLYFCGLGHSWDGCATSDNFLDIDQLTFEPYFEKHMQDAMAPVGLMLRVPDRLEPGHRFKARVIAFNDLENTYQGGVKVSWSDNSGQQSQAIEIPPYGRTELEFEFDTPGTSGCYGISATLPETVAGTVSSRRMVTVAE